MMQKTGWVPMTHAPLDTCRNQPHRRRIATIAVVAALLVSSCGSDEIDDSPAIVPDSRSTTPLVQGEGGAPLEPGSNLPPTDAARTPSGSTADSGLLAPADTLVGPGD